MKLGHCIAALLSLLPVAAAAQAGGAPDSARRIVPGRQIGSVSLGEDADTVHKRLGQPSTGDAAMMKAWETWYSPAAPGSSAPQNQVDIYLQSTPGKDERQRVGIVRVTSPYFRTDRGIGTGSPYSKVHSAYPAASRITTYRLTPSAALTYIYDDIRQGIAFEITGGRDGSATAGRCTAIIVHPKGQKATDTYLGLPAYLQGLATQPSPPTHK